MEILNYHIISNSAIPAVAVLDFIFSTNLPLSVMYESLLYLLTYTILIILSILCLNQKDKAGYLLSKKRMILVKLDEISVLSSQQNYLIADSALQSNSTVPPPCISGEKDSSLLGRAERIEILAKNQKILRENLAVLDTIQGMSQANKAQLEKLNACLREYDERLISNRKLFLSDVENNTITSDRPKMSF